jgi:hypothetical protein
MPTRTRDSHSAALDSIGASGPTPAKKLNRADSDSIVQANQRAFERRLRNARAADLTQQKSGENWLDGLLDLDCNAWIRHRLKVESEERNREADADIPAILKGWRRL